MCACALNICENSLVGGVFQPDRCCDLLAKINLIRGNCQQRFKVSKKVEARQILQDPGLAGATYETP